MPRRERESEGSKFLNMFCLSSTGHQRVLSLHRREGGRGGGRGGRSSNSQRPQPRPSTRGMLAWRRLIFMVGGSWSRRAATDAHSLGQRAAHCWWLLHSAHTHSHLQWRMADGRRRRSCPRVVQSVYPAFPIDWVSCSLPNIYQRLSCLPF